MVTCGRPFTIIYHHLVGKRRADRKPSMGSNPWHETVDVVKIALTASLELPIGDQRPENQTDGPIPTEEE
jgi:hypothetical protein